MKKTVVAIFVALAMFPLTGRSQDASGVALPFAALCRSAESLSMGGTSIFDAPSVRVQDSFKLDASAFVMPWNAPAGKTLGFGADFFGKIGQKFGGGLSFLMDRGQSYDIYSGMGNPSGKFTPVDMAIGGSLGFSIMPAVSVGASVRYLSSKLTERNKIGAIGADVMVSGNFSGISYAAGVTNLGTKAKDISGNAYPIPTAITVAGGYEAGFGEKHAIEARVQGDWFLRGGIRAGLGAQYVFNNMVSVRAGYSYGGKTVLPSYASLGAGVQWKGIRADAAFLIGGVTGSMLFTIGYRF